MELIEGVVDIVKGALETAGVAVESAVEVATDAAGEALENPYVRLDIVTDEIRNTILLFDEAGTGFVDSGFVDVDKII